MKFNDLKPALALWVVLDVLFYVATLIWPSAATALSANMYIIGALLGVLIAFWAGKLIGKANYSDAIIAGIAVGIAASVPVIALFGYGSGFLGESQAFGALVTIISIGAAVVGNSWK